ncbi:MAG: hypothetical protein NT062_35665, partial [Proteobacteria bacterium]|nr:hypothetical protein [Pseudomonadota bacterium]
KPTPTPAPTVAAPAPTPPTPPPTKLDPAEAFQTFAVELGKRTHRTVDGWGVVTWADGPGHYATFAPVNHADGAGAYLFELGDKRWLVEVNYDGRTQMFGTDDTKKWNPTAPATFKHGQSHRGGYDNVVLTIAGGKLVVLEHETLEDGRTSDKPTIAKHACPACPELTADPASDTIQKVRGPATTLDDLLK